MKTPIEAPDSIAAAIEKPGVIAANAIASTISGAAAGRVRVTTSAGPAAIAATSRTNGPSRSRTARCDPTRTAAPDHATRPIPIAAGVATSRRVSNSSPDGSSQIPNRPRRTIVVRVIEAQRSSTTPRSCSHSVRSSRLVTGAT